MDYLVNTAATSEEVSEMKRTMDTVSSTVVKMNEMVDLMFSKMQGDIKGKGPEAPPAPIQYPAIAQPQPISPHAPSPGVPLADYLTMSREELRRRAPPPTPLPTIPTSLPGIVPNARQQPAFGQPLPTQPVQPYA
ncbi:hypothetical protein GQX73_g3961 [Xylaria multiplex]|uniref:Uncharacterized protein n=1 Tax=Xylaria multiplex TaxID=323545 RepID=A0A7C8MSQ4_9PEZI|nr:hypothetical protein GQX73_g3961 [Xylaria multiplex]